MFEDSIPVWKWDRERAIMTIETFVTPDCGVIFFIAVAITVEG